MSTHCNLPEHIFHLYFTNPISRRAVEWFCTKSQETICVGKAKMKVPWDPVQLMFRSKFWQLCTEDGETPDWILKEFDIEAGESEFWLGWYIANGLLNMPGDPHFTNIYCDNLMIQGYEPEQERKNKIPQIIPFSSKLFQEGLASFQRQFKINEQARQAMEKEEDASELLQVLRVFEKVMAESPTKPEYVVRWSHVTDKLKYNLKRCGFSLSLYTNDITLTMPRNYIR
jgi:hypothetical protein